MSSAKPSSAAKKKDKDDTTNPDLNLPTIGNYIFQKTLGEGNFAKVKLAKHKLTGAEVAIKIIDKTTLDDKKLGKLYREVRIMKMLHHPHIIKLYEVIETKRTVFLVMEHAAGGELYDYLVVHGKMKEKEARAKFRQILSAVNYCHRKRVIHRDLKAENLLLDANLDIKIADFGFSNMFDPDAKLDTFCGSPPYAAPELFQGRRYTGPEVDIWSLGVILYVLTTGCLPFDGKNLQEMRESVCRGKYRIPFYLSDTCEKLLRKFLIRDPYKRASLEMLTDDQWINEGYPDSPIQVDISQKFEQDDSIIRLIETRFKVDRETVINCIKDNVYDDIAALYYLLYYEKETRGKIENEVMSMGGPSPMVHGRSSSVTSPATTFIDSPISPVTISSRSSSSSASSPSQQSTAASSAGAADVAAAARPVTAAAATGAPKVPAMVRIDEDGDALPAQPAPSSSNATADASQQMADIKTRPLVSNKPRKRRVTVGGEAEMLKLGGDEDAQAAKNILKQIQGAGGAVSEVDEQQLAPEPPKSKPPGGVTSAFPSSSSAHGASVSATSAYPPAVNIPATVPDENGELDIMGGDVNGQPIRKRNNTIVGIIRNSIRRQSEIPTPLSSHNGGPGGSDKNGETEGSNSFSNNGMSDASTDSQSKPGEPRSLRFTFNSNSTSSKPPDDIIQEVISASTKHGIAYALISRYLLECTANVGGGETVKLEVEVCKLPRLKNLHGLRFKRLGGSSGEYKDVCEKILNTVAL